MTYFSEKRASIEPLAVDFKVPESDTMRYLPSFKYGTIEALNTVVCHTVRVERDKTS